MKLEPAQFYRRDNISRRVCFREHILDLQAAIDVPLRHIMIEKHLYYLGRELLGSFSLSCPLHYLERHFRLYVLVEQIRHDTVTRSDNLGNRTGSVLDKVFRVAEPNVRTVRKSRYLQKVAEFCRFCVKEHLYREARAHFRYAETSGLAVYLLWRDSQNIAVRAHSYNVRIRRRNVLYLHARQILQVLVERRNDVSKLIKLEYRVVERVEVEVGRDNFGIRRISRVLNGSKIVNVII